MQRACTLPVHALSCWFGTSTSGLETIYPQSADLDGQSRELSLSAGTSQQLMMSTAFVNHL
jgi:hypothetical protein